MTPEELERLASQIAAHASKKHLAEYKTPRLGRELDIEDTADLEGHIVSTMLDRRTRMSRSQDGRVFFYNRPTNTVVYKDSKGSGTVFRPVPKRTYVKGTLRDIQKRHLRKLPFERGGLMTNDRTLRRTLVQRALANETPVSARQRFNTALREAGGVGPAAIRTALATTAKRFAMERAGLERAAAQCKDSELKSRLRLRMRIEKADHTAVMKEERSKLHAKELGAGSTPTIRALCEAREARDKRDNASQEWHQRAVRDQRYECFDPKLTRTVEAVRKAQIQDRERLRTEARLRGWTPDEERRQREALEKRLEEQKERAFGSSHSLGHSR